MQIYQDSEKKRVFHPLPPPHPSASARQTHIACHGMSSDMTRIKGSPIFCKLPQYQSWQGVLCKIKKPISNILIPLHIRHPQPAFNLATDLIPALRLRGCNLRTSTSSCKACQLRKKHLSTYMIPLPHPAAAARM